jgi:hypothetical protein
VKNFFFKKFMMAYPSKSNWLVNQIGRGFGRIWSGQPDDGDSRSTKRRPELLVETEQTDKKIQNNKDVKKKVSSGASYGK